jgi:hypothetical protein
MNFSINTFFDESECEEIIEFCEKNGTQFSYNESETWDCKRIYNDEFKEKIISTLKEKYNSKQFNLWFDLNDFNIKDINISLTKYYDGRWLDLHLDSTSQLTTVIVLSKGFSDGRFVLSKTHKNLIECDKHELNIGQSITFDGSIIYHGVMPVTTGIRCALNIWITNTDFKYYKLDSNKKLL